MTCVQEINDVRYHERCFAIEAEKLLRENPGAVVRLDCFTRSEFQATKSLIAEELRPRVRGTWLVWKGVR